MDPVGSLPHSQTPATCLYPEPAQYSPYLQILAYKTYNHTYSTKNNTIRQNTQNNKNTWANTSTYNNNKNTLYNNKNI
jgi:hypothetical protein